TGTPETRARRADGSAISNAQGAPMFNIRGGNGAAKISGRDAQGNPNGFGVTELIAAMNQKIDDPAIPLVKGVGFMGGNILLGGEGSDTLEGMDGDDLIDGDLWLNVQLRAVYNDGTVRFVDNAQDLVDDVFADPQRLNPGNISIIRTLVTPPPVPPDCGAAVPLNCDIAVFSATRDQYDISLNPNGTVVVTDLGKAVPLRKHTGRDTLRNIELL